jgi:beta-glucosidase
VTPLRERVSEAILMNATDPHLLHGAAPERFSERFLWGVATSAFQIEGAARDDGKGESIWDRFCRVPGAIADGSTGDVACDHVHRLDEDLDLIAALGVNAYRFSVSWPRVQPGGRGLWNERGLAFYDRLVDGLLARGVQPYLTLNHWDLPAELQDAGGWGGRDTVYRFVDYAVGVAARLGDRVSAIATHNEPWVIATLGHENGEFAPGVRDRKGAMQAAHHLLLSHGLALRALRDAGCRAQLGIILNLAPVVPASASDEDAALARLEDGRLVRWYMDPLFGRGYPADIWAYLGHDVPHVHEGDLAAIAAPMDYLGVNYYSRVVVGAGSGPDRLRAGAEFTEMGWEVYPSGLTDLLLRLQRDYPVPPIVVTENGAAFQDELVDGRVHDPERMAYLARHIRAIADAIALGVPVNGYMVWSLLDNFEWTRGYTKRFGLVHVDYATQRRTFKDSGHWYRDFLARWRASAHPAQRAAGDRAPASTLGRN